MPETDPFPALMALRERPAGPALMFQRWRWLTFLHRRVPAEAIQALLPAGLTAQTWPPESGDAWLGLVPFRMEGIRFRGFPPIPGNHAFPETNVRTYVTDERGRRGVWFFSLDASNPFAVFYASRRFGLPYVLAKMRVRRTGDRVRYRSARIESDGACEVDVRVKGTPKPAEPGSFEFWLVERYLLFARHRGRLVSCQVHHAPYTLQPVEGLSSKTNLLNFRGILDTPGTPWDHTCFSPGVDVEVFAPEPL